MKITIKAPVKFEGVHYAAGSADLEFNLSTRMIVAGVATSLEKIKKPSLSEIKSAILSAQGNNPQELAPWSPAPSYAANIVYGASQIVRGIGANSDNLYCMIGALAGTFTASLTSNVLTVTALSAAYAEPFVGQNIPGVNGSDLRITGVTAAWNGTTGTYTVNPRTDFASQTIGYGNNNINAKSGAASPPTGTSNALIADNNCKWFYLGKGNSAGTYPLFSTVIPSTAASVMNGYVAMVEKAALATLGLSNEILHRTTSPFMRTTGHLLQKTNLSPAIAYAGHKNNLNGSIWGSWSTARTKNTFGTNAQKWLSINGVANQRDNRSLGIEINGRFLSETPVASNANGTELSYLIDISKFGKGPKTISLYCARDLDSHIRSVSVQPGETVWAVNPANSIRFALEGTSITEGGGWGRNIEGNLLESIVANMCGFDSFYNNASGGTGTLSGNGTSTTYSQRLDDLVLFNPDILFIEFHNDRDFITQTNGETARVIAQRAYFVEVLEKLPDVQIFATGIIHPLRDELLTPGAGKDARYYDMEVELKNLIDSFGSSRIKFVPCLTATPPQITTSAPGWSFDVSDGHPNARPYDSMIAPFIANAIKGFYAEN